MLIARLLNYIRDAKTFHVFLLEIVAVFIGITGSLFVDNWRQEQNDREVLDHLLQETHYNALLDQSYVRQLLNFNEAALESLMVLTYEDLNALPDSELLKHFRMAMTETWAQVMQPGYRRLLNTSLSIPFDNTIAELDWHFRNLELEIADMKAGRHRSTDAAIKLARLVGLPSNLNSTTTAGLTGLATRQYAVLFNTLSEEDGYQENIDDAAGIRAALVSDQVRAILKEMIGHKHYQQIALINAGQSVRGIVRSIRRYDPDITLPVGSIGILGSAANNGWERSIEMQQSSTDPNNWTIEIVLGNGEVKFRADDDWSSDWGTPNLPQNIDSDLMTSGPFGFAGDSAEVFPEGIAEFKGLNIPVSAGHYHVTFNSQTFAYSFERLDQ